MSRLPASEWQVEQLRLTAFPVAGASTRRTEWWEAATGQSPDETNANPKKGSALVSGAFGDGKLLLRLEPERIDWVFQPADMEADALPPVGFPAIGAIKETRTTFSAVITKWLGEGTPPDLARVAFGAVLVHPEADRRAGYERLPDYIPVQVDPESSDFLFQVNLAVSSGLDIPGLRVNRLSKWTVAAWRVLAVGATGPTFLREPVFALRLELDINTVPDSATMIPRDRVRDVFEELQNLGFALAINGLNDE